ncbi:MAG: DUF883 family protein [Candidatus Hydrogenedentes bacterium]|nr:DUF883 family protein [Candidatus Hydrogenedentota bacterium]
MENQPNLGAGTTATGPGAATADTPKSEMDVLKSDLAKLKDDLRMVADSMKERAKAQAYSAKGDAEHRMKNGLDAVEDYVEEKPLQTVLMAFGVGLLLGTILSPK